MGTLRVVPISNCTVFTIGIIGSWGVYRAANAPVVFTLPDGFESVLEVSDTLTPGVVTESERTVGIDLNELPRVEASSLRSIPARQGGKDGLNAVFLGTFSCLGKNFLGQFRMIIERFIKINIIGNIQVFYDNLVQTVL